MTPSPHSDGTAPRWVKLLGVIAVVIVLAGAAHLLSGGGPGFHTLASHQEHGATP